MKPILGKALTPSPPPPHTLSCCFVFHKYFHLPCLLGPPQQPHHTDEKTEAHRSIMFLPLYHALPIGSDHAWVNTYLHSSWANRIHSSILEDVDDIFSI